MICALVVFLGWGFIFVLQVFIVDIGVGNHCGRAVDRSSFWGYFSLDYMNGWNVRWGAN